MPWSSFSECWALIPIEVTKGNQRAIANEIIEKLFKNLKRLLFSLFLPQKSRKEKTEEQRIDIISRKEIQ